MHITSISDQTDHTRTRTLNRYDGASLNEYLSDSDSYNNKESNCKSDDNNNYEFNYESDNEEASCASTSNTRIPLVQPPNVKEQKATMAYTLRQEKFNNNFSSKGSSLYNAYDQNEVEDKLVIKIDQDNQASKFSVADDISKVYGLPRIHECINDQKPLRAVIDINATQEDLEANRVKPSSVFFHICYSFIRALYRILDCS
ncbi:hypothetical protein C1646_676760 [Rhizophagus diaphanus]|nr:hypothetical protein C1646_676760 [Rhizophagus diaphanus] [Rhizophagus sp. MUCL 43196]